VVKVVEGSGGYNRWSFDIDATAFKPDEYIVTVSGIIQDVKGSAYFNIINALPPTSAITTIPVPDTTVIPTTTLLPPTVAATTKSPVPFWTALGALFVLALVRKKD
jgi:trimeric autotransporter adhesin